MFCGHEKHFREIRESRMEERLVFAFRAAPSPGGFFSKGRDVGEKNDEKIRVSVLRWTLGSGGRRHPV